jgi:hypothetical protein
MKMYSKICGINARERERTDGEENGTYNNTEKVRNRNMSDRYETEEKRKIEIVK